MLIVDGKEYLDFREFIRESMKNNEEDAWLALVEDKEERIRKLSNNSGLPEHFKNKTFENFDGSHNPYALEVAKEFVRKQPHSHGLLFKGDVGLGKTHLAAAISNELNKSLTDTYFGNVTDIINFCKSTYNKNSELTEAEAIDIMTDEVGLLIIDDLGKENSTEYTNSILYQIINKIYENERPVVITTNFSSSELSQKFGDRGDAIVSRINAICTPIVFKGKDWRLFKNGI